MKLKFRAWHKELKQMLPVYKMDWGFVPPAIYLSKDGARRQPMYGLENIELMQWSGLQDKNNKDIYEGDIVVLGDVDNFFIERLMHTHVLTWDQKTEAGIFRHRKSMDDFCQHDFKVVGNIYENPELLEKK